MKPAAVGKQISQILLTFALAIAGAGLFWWLTLPLPFMMGALFATTVGALLRMPLRFPKPLRMLVTPIIGVLLGSYFTMAFLQTAVQLWPALVSVGVVLAFCMAVGPLFFERFAGLDRVSALMAAAPGGAPEMITLGAAYGVNNQSITIIHSVRIMTAVFVLPLSFWLIDGVSGGVRLDTGFEINLGLSEILMLCACAIIGGLAGHILNMPAGVLVGPLVFSAVAHIAGFIEVEPPTAAVAFAQMVIGASLGAGLANIRHSQAWRAMMASICWTLIVLAVGAMTAISLASAGLASFAPVLLGSSPGGFTEMALLSVALGVDTVFVSVCHIGRISATIVVVPAYLKLTGHRR